MHYESLKALLAKNDLSLTKPRKAIFDLLLDREPQDMQAIVARAKGKVDRATVYRTIEMFEKFGIVQRLQIGWKYKIELSDVFLDHHHHFYCTNCGQTLELSANPMLETMINSTVLKEGLAARGHQLEIYGLCASCSRG